MKPHEERVITERQELDDKIKKLLSFIGGQVWNTMKVREQEILYKQLVAMRAYSVCLQQRIDLF